MMKKKKRKKKKKEGFFKTHYYLTKKELVMFLAYGLVFAAIYEYGFPYLPTVFGIE